MGSPQPHLLAGPPASSSGSKPTSQHNVAVPGGELTPQGALVPASQVTTGMWYPSLWVSVSSSVKRRSETLLG